MFSVQSVVELCFFPLTLIAATLLYARGLKPRKLCWLWLVCGFVVTCAFMVLANYLRHLVNGGSGNQIDGEMADWLTYYLSTAGVNIVVVALITVTFRLSFKGSGIAVILAMTAGYATEGICSSIVNIFVAAFGEISLMQAIQSNAWFSMLLLVYVGIYAAGYFLLSKRYKDLDEQFFDGKSVIVFVAIILVNIVLGSVSSSPDAGVNRIYILLSIGIIFCCVFVLIVQFLIFDWYRLKMNNLYQKDFIEHQEEGYAQMKKQIDAVGIKVHDLKHIVSAIREGGIGNEEELDEIESTLNAGRFLFNTGNDILDVVLSEKGSVCFNEGIDFTVIADGSALSFMSEIDTYSFFCNALDNAIEAARKIEDGVRFISVNIRSPEPGKVTVRVENSMVGEVKFSEQGIPITNKSDRTLHGYGSKSILSIATKYRGTVELYVENQIYNLIVTFSRPI